MEVLIEFYLKVETRTHSENSLQEGGPGMGRGGACIPLDS